MAWIRNTAGKWLFVPVNRDLNMYLPFEKKYYLQINGTQINELHIKHFFRSSISLKITQNLINLSSATVKIKILNAKYCTG
jgi:hypothetical protein